MAVVLVCSTGAVESAGAGPGVRIAQTPAPPAAADTVTGTVKSRTEAGIVVVGRDTGNTDREWVFVVDAGTRVESGNQPHAASELKAGDPVTVAYTNRDGKVIAQRVTVNSR